MQRRNLKQAFIGEGDPNQEGLAVEQEGQEDVAFRVVDGYLAVVVPAGTPEEALFRAQTFTRAELVLDNGLRVTLGIHADTVGAQIDVTSGTKATEEVADLSTANHPTRDDA